MNMLTTPTLSYKNDYVHVSRKWLLYWSSSRSYVVLYCKVTLC